MANEFTMKIPGDVCVSWTITSQAANRQEMEIKDPNGTIIANTAVYSTNLSNFSRGTFTQKGI